MKNTTEKSSTRKKSDEDKVPKVKPKPISGKKIVGGLLFVHRGIPYMTVKAWLKAGCPEGTYVYGTVDELILCHLPISDAVCVNGVYAKTDPKPMVEHSYRIPWYIVYDWKSKVFPVVRMDSITFSTNTTQTMKKSKKK
jgi:hypothetical protein